MKTSLRPHPLIIQGGMGMGISDWRLARAVAMLGQQGTVSGVALERLVALILRMGDPGGHIRRALAHFPFPVAAQSVLDTFYVEGGQQHGDPYTGIPVWSINSSRRLIELRICADFAFVWLAKEGHDGIVGINYLEKLAMPHIYAILGAMLAGVDFITMGAGIVLKIPDVINAIINGETVSYPVPVTPCATGKNITSYLMSFNPAEFLGGKLPLMKKPGFLPIISSNSLANILLKELSGEIYGFCVEEWTAGGHNAAPRHGAETYGKKDMVDYAKLAALGLPFWIGGSYASPEKLAWALSVGASGIQVGTIFALCEESGMDPQLRRQARELGYNGKLKIRTDAFISPTGYRFKVLELPGTISKKKIRDRRIRVCDQGALVSLYEKPDGTIGYRCPSEPVDIYIGKGGKLSDTVGRGCLCDGLIGATGINAHLQRKIPVITGGDDVSFLKKVMSSATSSYTVADALRYLTGGK